jgi:hypothetical protein
MARDNMAKFFVDHNCKWTHMRAGWFARRLGLLALLCLLASGFGLERWAMAQSQTALWSTPVNISNSGGASQPAITAAPDGTLYALWWDSAEGEQFAQTTTAGGLGWTEPISVSQIYGRRKLAPDPDTGKLHLVLDPPLDLRLLSDSQGKVYAIWRDNQNQLSVAQWQGPGWGAATVLDDSTVKADATTDNRGVMHVAYIRSQNSSSAPPGVYYRSASNGKWTVPSLVYASLYFRTIAPEAAHVSLAADASGRVVISWDAPELGQSVYADSTDGGHSWSRPQGVSGNQTDQAVQAFAVPAPSGNFFLIWKAAGVASCELHWRRSGDGGVTWGAAGPLYNDISTCPQRLRFPLANDNKTWLLGLVSLQQAANSGGRMALESWDGSRWSSPVDVNLNFEHPTLKNKELLLDDLDLALAGQSLGIVGKDSEGDIWALRNAVPPSALVSALAPVWNLPEMVSDPQSSAQVKDPPALVADPQGKLYTMWSESLNSTEPGSALYVAVRDQGRWSRAVQLFQSAGATTSASSGSLAEEPSLAIDSASRLYAVWRGGPDAQLLQSSTFASDFTAAATWSKPAALPMPGRPSSWPDLVVDPISGTLHVIFAVPFNEGRGIYHVQSNDGGANWSAPVVVCDAAAAKWDSVDKPRLAIDAATRVLHAVWLQAGLTGEAYARAVVYGQSADGGRSWTAPAIRAAAPSDWPRLAVVRPNVVYIVWDQAASNAGASAASWEVWGQMSSDGGQHWTDPKLIPGFDVTGPVDLVPDGVGGLELVGMGQNAGGGADLIYSHWDGQAWSKPEASDLGYDAAPGNAVTAVFVPAVHRLDAALQALVGTLGGSGQFRLLSTGRQVQAAPSGQLTPTFAALPSPTATTTARPTPTPTVEAAPSLNPIAELPPASPSALPISTSILAGGVLIVLVASAMVIVTLIRMAKR